MSDLIHSQESQKALDDLLESLEESLKVAKAATTEADRLKVELARKDRIILEKVASAKPTPTLEKVEELVDSMVDHGIAKQADAKILTEQLMAHPDNLVKLAASLAIVSMPAPRQAVGIAKEASTAKYSESDHDGWGNVIRDGA